MQEKLKIKELIVVEGKTDIDFLSSFLNADFYSVNGSAVNDEDIKFLEKIADSKGIIILTDPDFPGQKIRNFINLHIPNCKNAYVRKEFSIKNHKVGVAESTKEEVLYSLKNLIVFDNKNEVKFTKTDLFNLGLTGRPNSKELRNKLCAYLNIGFSNPNQLLKKLNALEKVQYNDIKEILDASN